MANAKTRTFSKIHAQHYFLEKIKSYLTVQFSLLIGMDEKRDCKGDWGTRLQENPQLILHLVVMIQLTSRRILRD